MTWGTRIFNFCVKFILKSVIQTCVYHVDDTSVYF